MTASSHRGKLALAWRTGLLGLRLQAWVRGQRWLQRIYRLLPSRLRNGVLTRMSSRSESWTRFRRTVAWDEALSQMPVWPPRDQVGISPALGHRGVNILGYVRGEFGLAEGARAYARALISAGVPVALYDLDLGLPHSRQERSLDAFIDESMPHDVTIVFVNPDYIEAAFERVGRERLRGQYVIACWFWELEVVPESWLPAIELVDEIMVASLFIEDAFRRVTDKPILRVPLPVPVAEGPDSGLQRSDFGLEPDKFIFLCTFDFHSFVARKNPQAVVCAFQQAFPAEREDVRLLLKTSNGRMHPDAMRELLDLVSGDTRITLRDEVIDRAHMRALQRCCDAYVSLHRAEGFGLGLAECMALGKPVIATGWSGNMEFMTPDSACLVDYDLVPVAGRYPESEGAQWADPRIDGAVVAMRALADDPGYAHTLGNAAKRQILASLSQDQAAHILVEKIAAVHAVGK